MTSSKKCTLLVILSVLIYFLAFLFKVLGLKLWFGFEVLCFLFVFIGSIFAVIAIIYIVSSGEIHKIRGKILILVHILVSFYIGFGSFGKCILDIKARRALAITNQISLQKIGNEMLSYEIKTGHLPDSNDWCNSIFSRKKTINHITFAPAAKQDAPNSFAFNYNLSELPIDGLGPNTVLIFEADGPWNFTAGPEQFPGSRYRDRYFPWKDRFAYLFFVDGSLVIYRLHDGAVALQKPTEYKRTSYLKFTDWFMKGETPYSPLKWK